MMNKLLGWTMVFAVAAFILMGINNSNLMGMTASFSSKGISPVFQKGASSTGNHTRAYYISLASEDAEAVGLNSVIFVKQITEESNFNPQAISPAGAIGIAQFMPATAAGLGLNPYDPVASLNGAAHLMRNYVTNYGGSYPMALAAYNAGPGWVAQARQCGMNWYSCLPAETQKYIAIILGW